MQVVPTGGQIWNQCKCCHVVAEIIHRVDFWVRCASGNVYHIGQSVLMSPDVLSELDQLQLIKAEYPFDFSDGSAVASGILPFKVECYQ